MTIPTGRSIHVTPTATSDQRVQVMSITLHLPHVDIALFEVVHVVPGVLLVHVGIPHYEATIGF